KGATARRALLPFSLRSFYAAAVAGSNNSRYALGGHSTSANSFGNALDQSDEMSKSRSWISNLAEIPIPPVRQRLTTAPRHRGAIASLDIPFRAQTRATGRLLSFFI